MTSYLGIESLKELNFIPDETVPGNYRINLKSVITFLTKHSSSVIRSDSIRRTFGNHHKGLLNIEGIDYVSQSSLLRFIFLHYDKIDICRKIAEEIGLLIHSENIPSRLDTADSTILQIYKSVAKLNIKSPYLLNHFFNGQVRTLQDNEIPTLYHMHKFQFENQHDWEKIKLFEWHFSRLTCQNKEISFEEEISRRKDFLNDIEKLLNFQPVLHRLCKDTINNNSARKSTADIQNGILLTGRGTHIPMKVDCSLLKTLQEHFPNDIQQVVCIGCQTSRCRHDSGLHVYVELLHDSLQSDLSDVYVLLQSHLQRVHSEHCAEVVVLKHGTLANYDEPVKRFHLHDDWILGRLNLKTVASSSFADEIDNPGPGRDLCEHCSTSLLHDFPLDWRNLSVDHEWIIHVPLMVQILMEPFINLESMKRSSSPQEYITNKIQRLYSSFDTLLNILNRCYLGIFQTMASDELSISYHSVDTVFSVASQGGLTCSFQEAERRLKRQADPSLLYYKAYIEEHELQYNSVDGSTQKSISLRDCHLILGLDNLVRLTFHKDTQRGDSRTSQICTLPITIMGIPKDTLQIQSWHDQSICDGSNECPCKDSITLTEDDFKMVFLTPNAEEQKQMVFFDLSITWGLQELWSAFAGYPELSDVIKSAIQSSGPVDIEEDIEVTEAEEIQNLDLEFLNYSMQSMELSDEDESCSNDTISTVGTRMTVPDEDCVSDQQNISTVDDDASLSSVDWDTDSEFNFVPLDQTDTDLQDMESNPTQSLANQFDSSIVEDTVSSLGFKVYVPPPMLCRHPPPVEGRDDDPKILQDILRDILLKTGNNHNSQSDDRARILFAPDNKIGKNLFKIMKIDTTFQRFLPEFPLLHLRKSKINSFRAAYEDIGLFYLLGFMQDREVDMKKLLSMDNIEDATRNVRRISLSLHLAFMIKFLEYIPEMEAVTAYETLTSAGEEHRDDFHQRYLQFLETSSKKNATFALHREMMIHSDEILAVSVAERIGGPDGYNLLLAAVKSSLPFSFVNGASSYAVFCSQLLHAHYSAGPFHAAMKKNFFSTPYRGSRFNFALDTQREFDHRDAVKAFRPRARASSVLPRMSLVDTFAKMSTKSQGTIKTEAAETSEDDPVVRTWKVTKHDVSHIVPTALLILREGALDLQEESQPRNVYAAGKPLIPNTALDLHTQEIGEYLVKRFAHLNGFCGLPKEVPPISIQEPKELVTRVKNMKEGFTVRRMKCRVQNAVSDKEKKEKKRQQRVKHLTDVVNCLTSEMNTCQAVLKPDCTKWYVNKAMGIKKALITVLETCIEDNKPADTEERNPKQRRADTEKTLKQHGMVLIGSQGIHVNLMKQVKVAIFEFAGVKFKTGAVTGSEYIEHVENNIINKTLRQFPRVEHVVICEEKYGFTPDYFKAATRCHRKKPNKKSLVHLKRGSEIISMETFDKKAACSTSEGKAITSTFLAVNANNLRVIRPITLKIDSEWILETCTCTDGVECTCPEPYTVPIQMQFGENGLTECTRLSHIHQRKGEAEMAVIDWLLDLLPTLKEGESAMSVITSGDIDAIPIHMFALSQHWPRTTDDTFLYPVYVVLQKPKGVCDVYNVTKMIECIDRKYGKASALKMAVVLCFGGNDFMLKFSGISHEKIIQTFTSKSIYMKGLISFAENTNFQCGSINKELFHDFVKDLYCPTRLDVSKLTFEQVQHLSFKDPGKPTMKKPRKWMPPKTALDHIASLIDYQIEYLYGAGYHSATLPDFLAKGCLRKDKDDNITYYLGPDSYICNPESLLQLPDNEMKSIVLAARKPRARKQVALTSDVSTSGDRRPKRRHEDTPQKGRRRKRKPTTSTPSKTDSTRD